MKNISTKMENSMYATASVLHLLFGLALGYVIQSCIMGIRMNKLEDKLQEAVDMLFDRYVEIDELKEKNEEISKLVDQVVFQMEKNADEMGSRSRDTTPDHSDAESEDITPSDNTEQTQEQ